MDKDIYIFPISFAQQRLWFLDQFEPGNPFYNIPSAIRIEGALQVAALEQSLHELIRRHEALRSTFAMIDGEPSQVIHPFVHFTLEKVDLRELSETEREAEAFRLALEEAQQPFDLARGPLLRTRRLQKTSAWGPPLRTGTGPSSKA